MNGWLERPITSNLRRCRRRTLLSRYASDGCGPRSTKKAEQRRRKLTPARPRLRRVTFLNRHRPDTERPSQRPPRHPAVRNAAAFVSSSVSLVGQPARLPSRPSAGTAGAFHQEAPRRPARHHRSAGHQRRDAYAKADVYRPLPRPPLLLFDKPEVLAVVLAAEVPLSFAIQSMTC